MSADGTMSDAPAPAGAPAGLASDAILERLLHLHPKIIDLTLDRVWRVLLRLPRSELGMLPTALLEGRTAPPPESVRESS